MRSDSGSCACSLLLALPSSLPRGVVSALCVLGAPPVDPPVTRSSRTSRSRTHCRGTRTRRTRPPSSSPLSPILPDPRWRSEKRRRRGRGG
ncbi:hypothetical protein C8J57DRAFT_1301607 [Mycena rebaudengoi]|nr:hypothetical protein C8J57DRAFT_1301607 [Mycena rebaudengoi]